MWPSLAVSSRMDLLNERFDLRIKLGHLGRRQLTPREGDQLGDMVGAPEEPIARLSQDQPPE